MIFEVEEGLKNNSKAIVVFLTSRVFKIVYCGPKLDII